MTRRRGHVAAVAAAILVGVVVLILAVGDEPYHIDELRQVRAYSGSFTHIVDASFSQEQPPLDGLLNAGIQRIIGVGDVRQRAASMAFGVGSLVIVGWLLLRAGFGYGAGAGVLVMALSPNLAYVTAYARPYALPLFLILAFVLLTTLWLERRSLSAAVALVPVALLLPLARTVEPPLVLGATIAWLLILRLSGKRWPGSWTVPAAAAALALVVVALPVFLRLSDELAEYTATSVVRLGGLSRLATDLPEVLFGVITPVAIAVAVAALLWAPARHLLTAQWWLPVVAAVPIGFAIVFFLRTEATQSYVERYVFSWWPLLAVLAASLVAAGLARRDGVGAAALAVTSLFLGVIGWSAFRELTTVEQADWRAVSAAVDREAPEGAAVLFDSVRKFGLYRTPFAASPRYSGERSTVLSLDVARRPDLVPDAAPMVVVLLGRSPEVPGWSAQGVDGFFTLYLPDSERIGKQGAAQALTEFARVLPPEDGAAMWVAAAVLQREVGGDAVATELTCRAIDFEGPARDAVADFATSVGLRPAACG